VKTGLNWLEHGLTSGNFGHGNEPSGYIRGGKLIQLNDYQLLEKHGLAYETGYIYNMYWFLHIQKGINTLV
jgi:hypothetical protein